ncbi:MAG: zinc transporter ZntB [Pseudomonadota bacterium]
MMTDNEFIYALLLDGKGGAQPLSSRQIKDWKHEDGCLWLHLDYTDPAARQWLTDESNLDDIAIEALLTEETRPRTTLLHEGLLVALRGVNLSPGSNPEDMVAIRVWLDGHRIISSQKRRLLSIEDMVHNLKEGDGPASAGEFIVDLCSRLIYRMGDTLENIEEEVAELEEEVLSTASNSLRKALSSIRRESIALRRYLAPQREALTRLQAEKVSWITDNDRLRLREVIDCLIRYIEDLDAIRDRAMVTQEEIVNRLSEQMNMRMYVLSLVAAIFLPLGFFTGLLGINVPGIPGAENPWAFQTFILFLIIIVLLQVLLFKKKNWL